MSRTRVKICGITTSADALAAVAAGADGVGVIFAPSKRQVSVERASAILRDVPPMVARVGVFVDATAAQVAAAVEACGLHAVEFSGDESPEACAAVGVPVIKTLHVGEDFTWSLAEPYHGSVSAILLDTAAGGAGHQRGGTGIPFQWQRVTPLPPGLPVVLAGGLDPDNVAEAVRVVSPFAVDVASGVEVSPGVKDHARIAAFVSAVARADAEGVR